jgi:hypothetical protein
MSTSEIQPNRTYEVLEFPALNLPDIHRVKVLRVYDNLLLGRIVRFRYNWPFPITEEALETDFAKWVAK